MGGGGSALRVCAEHRGGINWLSLSPDGQRLLTGSEDGTARLWSAVDGQCCALLQGTCRCPPPPADLGSCSRIPFPGVQPPRTPARIRPAGRTRVGGVLGGVGPGRRAGCDRGQWAKGRPLRGAKITCRRAAGNHFRYKSFKEQKEIAPVPLQLGSAFPGPTPGRVTSGQTHLSGQSGLVGCGSTKHDSVQSSHCCYPTGADRETEAQS